MRWLRRRLHAGFDRTTLWTIACSRSGQFDTAVLQARRCRSFLCPQPRSSTSTRRCWRSRRNCSTASTYCPVSAFSTKYVIFTCFTMTGVYKILGKCCYHLKMWLIISRVNAIDQLYTVLWKNHTTECRRSSSLGNYCLLLIMVYQGWRGPSSKTAEQQRETHFLLDRAAI